MQKYAIIFVFSLFVVYVGVYSLKGKRERGRERNRITNFIVLGSIANIANTFSFIFFSMIGSFCFHSFSPFVVGCLFLFSLFARKNSMQTKCLHTKNVLENMHVVHMWNSALQRVCVLCNGIFDQNFLTAANCSNQQ